MQNQLGHKSIHKAENLILTIFWLIIFSAPVIFIDDFSWGKVFHDWQRLLPFLILALINHYLLVPFFFFRKRRQWYFVAAVIVLALFSLLTAQLRETGALPLRQEGRPEFQNIQPPPRPNLREFQSERPRPEMNRPGHPLPNGLPPMVNTFLIALLILGFDTGLRSFFKWSHSEQEREKLEKEKVKSELAFLKNQVSPHFFMNTLNNIHALIDFDKDEAKESIIRLSKLMRHLLYDSEVERIQLAKEVEFLRNYIDLMKLRFTDKVKVNLQISNQIPDSTIPPMLFTSFVENAFKHGVSYNAPSFINVALDFKEDKVLLKIENTNFSTGVQSKTSGIGLANIRKRLDLLYKDEYKLDIQNQRDVFVVNLSIPI